ncbi:hypothetical protein PEL8287_03348 [Roseovarius litorisediminis]|uniref:SPW repeat protein n=1 Tax=Roseovarius litorisediminis TaxID=1312363 RepID=A0A1Y5TGT3_9RHOB|nr:hypothetical protein [Roseovarius litorisediminis]SLN61694.1 hypothetical protein PEL8287_03348 [Roseovarius litorisediminis]
MIVEIWQSFRRMPLWVQIWVALILVPVNLAALCFWSAPSGGVVAVLAIGAMALNGVIMLIERGFSKLMAVPHVLIWTPLVVLIALLLASGELPESFRSYLLALLLVDVISLAFDVPDSWKWWKGDREIA